MGDIAVVNEGGTVGLLPEDQAKELGAAGKVRAATQEEFDAFKEARSVAKYDTAKGAAIAAGTGFAGGLTAGLSNPAIVGAARLFGGQHAAESTHRAMELSERANPVTHTVADVAGMATGAIATEGLLGAAGSPIRYAEKAGELAEHGVHAVLGHSRLAAIAARAVGSGLELGAIGATKDLSEQLTNKLTEEDIGTHPINYEHLASVFGKDMLMGAAFGGGIKMLTTMGQPWGVTKLLRKSGSAEERAAADAEHAAMGTESAATAEAGASAKAATNAHAKVTIEDASPTMAERGTSVRDFLHRAADGTELEDAAGKSLSPESLKESMREMGTSSFYQGVARGPVKKLVRKAEESYVGGAEKMAGDFMGDVEEASGKRWLSFSSPKQLQPYAEAVSASAGAKMNVIEGAFTGLDKELAKPTMADFFGGLESKLQKEYGHIGMESDYRAVSNIVESLKAKALGLEFGATPAAEDLARLSTEEMPLSQLLDLKKAIKGSKLDSAAKNLASDVRIEIAQAIDNRLNVIAEKTGKESLYAPYKAARQQWLRGELMGKILDEGATRSMTNVHGGLAGLAGTVAGGAIGMAGGPVTGILGASVGQGVTGYVRNRAAFFAADVLRSQKVSQLGDILMSQNKEIGKQASSLFDSLGGKGSKVTMELGNASILGATVESRASAVTRAVGWLKNPAVAAEVSDKMKELSEHAPQTAAGTAQHMGKLAAYMLATAPQMRQQDPLFPTPKGQEYHSDDVDKWGRKWTVLADWTSVVRAVKAGTATKDDINTLHQFYPQKYAKLRESAVGMMFDPAKQKKMSSLPIEQRLALATLLDIKTPTTDPGFIHALRGHGPQSEQGQKMPSPDRSAARRTAGDAKAAQAKGTSLQTASEGIGHGTKHQL